MKKSTYISIVFALLLWGCQDLDTQRVVGNQAGLVVHLDIPQPSLVQTRAGIGGEELDLYVLVFDKNGVFLSKHAGEFVSGTSTNANYQFGRIPTTREGELLILHFVANYDWQAFIDSDNLGKSEAEVMNKLTVTGGQVAYWQRVELPDGLVGATGTTVTLKDHVSLLRNIARIAVENLTNEPEAQNYLTQVTFAVGNYIDRGTVAPYSATSFRFLKGAVTEALDGQLVPLTDERAFVEAKAGSQGAPSELFYAYERKNSTARNQTYLIIKGFFQDARQGVNTTTPSYYKIDLADAGATSLLDIERNCSYILHINDVAMAGHPTLKEAVDGPASNNINAALQVAEYTSVSDGTNILQIEKSVVSFVASGLDFRITCSYYDGTTKKIDNAKLTVSLEQNSLAEVVRGGVFSYSDGVISGTTATIPTTGDIYQATFVVSDGAYLSRKITLRLRKPLTFLALQTTPNNGTDLAYCQVANQVGQPVTISFSFPPDISPYIFPLPVYIYAKKLSPDPTKEGIQPLSIDPKPGNTYRYVYMAPYLGNDAADVPRLHTVYLVTSSPSSNEDVTIESDYFNPAVVQIRSATIPAFDQVRFTPNPVARVANTPVVLTFNIPDVPDTSLPYRVRIHTDYLTFVSQSTGLDCVWDEVMGVYYYTTNTPGTQQITFRTTQAESSEFVRMDGDRFAAITVRRTVELGDFKDLAVDVPSGTAGGEANISFAFDALGSIYAAQGMDVIFSTQHLSPAAGSGVVATGRPNEYKLYVSQGTPQTARFVLRRSLVVGDGERVKLSAPGFKEAYVSYQIAGKFVFKSPVAGYESRPVFTYGGTPVSLAEVPMHRTVVLHFTIPASTKVNGAPVSASNPLWVYYVSSINTQYLTAIPDLANVAEFWRSKTEVAERVKSYRKLWFKITSVGDKTVELDTDVANDLSAITLRSVSGPGEEVSNDLFETATGIQSKN